MSPVTLEPTTVRSTPKQRPQTRRASSKFLSAAEERSLADRIRLGDRQAVDRLVLANLGLVGNIARLYLGCGLSYEDLKQEGIRGLLRACADFDPKTHNVRFSTYATYWVRNAIQKAVMVSGSMIRLPDYMTHLRLKYRRTLGELYAQGADVVDVQGQSPSREIDREIASKMGVSLQKLELVRKSDMERTQFHRDPDESETVAFEETIADNSQPILDLEGLEELDCLREGIDMLTPIEAWIIRQRFGLEQATEESGPKSRRAATKSDNGRAPVDSSPKSISWIARSYGLSPNTIRRFEASAIVKLREHMRKRVGDDQ